MVISRTSPCSSIIGLGDEAVIDFPFSGIGFAHRDDAQGMGAHCINQTDEAVVDRAKSNGSGFAVVGAQIFRHHCGLPIKALKMDKIKAALFKRCLPFGLIPFEFHADNICILKGLGNRRLRLGPTHQAWGPGTCG